MYESYFGLRERPFDLTPNPRFLLMTPTHKEALATLQYGLSARKGLTVLIGEAGSGKTTLIATALDEWRQAGHLVAHLSNPTLTRSEFFEYLAGTFALPTGTGESKIRFLGALTELVTRRHAENLITGLVIDEAQSLPDELLEEVRLLVNVETQSAKLFQVLLVGQPELADRLNQPQLRQIKQRIALRSTLSTLDVRQVAAYIAGRIQIAGGVAAHVLTREAVMSIHRYSNGIPRVISVICDNALLAGFAAGVRPITSGLVDEVCREFAIPETADTVDARFEPVVTHVVVRSPAEPASMPGRTAPVPPGSRETDRDTATEQRHGGLFQHYVAAGKRRFSFF